jgi:hypothetical protein
MTLARARAQGTRALAVAAALAAVAIAGPSAAIVANPKPRVCNEFLRSTYVFAGTVLGEGQLAENGSTELTHFYRVRVGEVFKGRMGSEVTLFTTNNSARGVLEAGRRSVIFAELFAGKAAFSGSSNTTSEPGVDAVIAEIRAVAQRDRQSASVAGRADIDGSPGHPAAGLQLDVAGVSGHHTVRTDSAGRFVVAVAPGRYAVRVAEQGWISRRGTYSYDDPADLLLPRGGCADVQLEVVRTRAATS